MARQLQERSSSESVGSIQVEGICEPTIALTNRRSSRTRVPAHGNRIRQSSRSVVGCEENGPSTSNCGQTHCRIPQPITATETTFSIRHMGQEYSRMEDEVLPLALGNRAEDAPREEQPLERVEEIEREIAIRLRRIGDQMNELYLQRRMVGERQWWRPLRWHLTQFISEILAALYNPLLDILPHN